jgi:hypothetical protein
MKLGIMLGATTYEIACACEQADAAHLAAQVSAIRVLMPTSDPVALPFAGGVAAWSVPRFGRKLNHVSGAGMEQPITREALSELREAYRARGLALELDLCPYARRRGQGYVKRALSTHAARQAACDDAHDRPPLALDCRPAHPMLDLANVVATVDVIQ